ncbi:type IV secretion system protein VirB1 [Xanthobacter sp. V13C-7B]|uniref:type IV secretion system protein VirB1 n=1 Tax=Xanthobacter variabilis TaxID=3119932 RepID=UPI00372C5AB2
MADPAALAAVVSIESGFNALAIRVNSNLPLKRQPASKAEAIQIASEYLAAGEQLSLGLGGISAATATHRGLGLSDLFEPCANLRLTGTLLTEYLRAKQGGAGKGFSVAFARYFGEGDAEPGFQAGYDKQALEAMAELKPRLRELSLTATVSPSAPTRSGSEARRAVVARPDGPAPFWDVYGAAADGQSRIIIFADRPSGAPDER